jgi:hypothetical protein
VRGLSCAAIDCACSGVPPLARYAVMPVARNEWLPMGALLPAARARLRIMPQGELGGRIAKLWTISCARSGDLPERCFTMTEDLRTRGLEFANRLAALPPEERARGKALSRKEELEQHKAFREKFKAGKCSFCGEALTSFDVASPCRHWLLKPDGFGKEHFERLAEHHSWSVLENYLRWVANEGAFARNVNDLPEEGTGKLVELSIRYKNLAWSFSCSVNDLGGHQAGSEVSKRPHYHFQMSVDGMPFIRYNDFHLPLSAADIRLLEHTRNNPDVKKRVAGGAGMSELLDESTLEQVLTMGRSGTSEEDVAKAPVSLTSFITAAPGTSIKGEDIMKLIQAASAEGVTATSKMRKLKDASVQTIVSPGDGVIPQAPRSGRKRRRKGRR